MIKRNFRKIYQKEIDPWNVGEAKGLIYEKVLETIKEIIKRKKLNNILDLGCGKGSFTNRLAELGENVIGIEISSIAIDYAKNHYPKIKFINGDIAKLSQIELEKNSFDLITVLDVLYYFSIKTIKKILEEIFDLLDDNGFLVLRHWSPGGGYLTHYEWQMLLSEKFKIVKSELLETQHSLLVCQKKFNNIVFTFDYETWQPLAKGLEINWDKDIFEPTEKLLDLADKHKVKLSFFAEMGEYYWCKKFMPEIAQKMEKQWQEIIRRGHDVQIHLHPAWLPECGAKFDPLKNEWYWNKKYQRIHDAPINIENILRRCKSDLEKILTPINPNYRAIVFRAGKYQIQPNKEIFESFKKVGILADSSVWKGGYSKEHHFDFRKAYSYHQPYFASKYDINSPASSQERDVLEIPIASDGYEKYCLDNFRFYKGLYFLNLCKDNIQKVYFRFSLCPFPPNCFSKKFLNIILKIYIEVLNILENLINRFIRDINNDDNIQVWTGHTKLQPNISELDRFFKYIKSKDNYKTELIRDIANEFYICANKKFLETKKKCEEIMNFVYNSLSPEKSQNSDDPQEILKNGYAWCLGYVKVMKFLCEKEGFKTRHYTLWFKNHPQGRGRLKVDTHEILEVKIDNQWVVFDPTVNRCLEYDFRTLLKDPNLVDKVLLNYKPDERWVKRKYHLYCSSFCYKNIIKYRVN